MSTLPRIFEPVQATRLHLAVFEPAPAEDLIWDLAFTLARDGEDPAFPRGLSAASALRWAMGRRAGRQARAVIEARELGRALGLASEISEPPTGYSAEEQAAYRAGFAEGQAEAEDDRAFAAWVAETEAERMDLAFADPVTDCDLYPSGCVS